MTKPLFVGLDVSHQTFDAVLLDQAGHRVGPRQHRRNQRPDAQAFADELVDGLRTGGFDAVLIGLEATNFYGWHLQDLLAFYEPLQPFHPQVYVLNPRLVHRFKKAFNDLPKTDPVDAWVIAQRLRFGELPHPCLLNRAYRPLQRLTRFRYQLMHHIVEEKATVLNHLFLKCSAVSQPADPADPEAPRLRPLAHAVGTVLVEVASVDELAAMSLEDLAQRLDTLGKGRSPDPQRLAQELQRAARASYRLEQSLADSVNLVLALSWQNIQTFQAQVKKVDQAIAREIAAFPEHRCLLSVPGIGPVFAAGLLAEIGPIARFDGHAALARYAGLTWRRHQSGTFEAAATPLLRSGNAYLRYFLVEAANSLRVHNPDYAPFYQRKYAESVKHPHKRALVLTARKFVRLVYALLSHQQLYQGTRAA
jgi:transposase